MGGVWSRDTLTHTLTRLNTPLRPPGDPGDVAVGGREGGHLSGTGIDLPTLPFTNLVPITGMKVNLAMRSPFRGSAYRSGPPPVLLYVIRQNPVQILAARLWGLCLLELAEHNSRSEGRCEFGRQRERETWKRQETEAPRGYSNRFTEPARRWLYQTSDTSSGME